MRKQRTHYRSAGRTGVGHSAITAGLRRRRARRAGRLAALIALAVVVAIVALLSAANTTSRRTAGSSPPTARRADPPATAPAGHAKNDTHRRPVGRDLAAIDGALRYTPFVATGVPRHRLIALTFDDGPSPYTPQVIRILLRMHVPATFFVVGQQLNDFSAGLREEVRNGFVVGDHTENHAWLSHLPAAAQYAQVHDAAIRIERLGASFPRLFRPPYGAFNQQTLRTARGLKMLMVLWSSDTGDWRRPGTGAIIGAALSGARPGGIVLMHDGGGDRSETVAALPQIIDGLRRRGYGLVSLPELVRLDPPPRHQHFPTGLFGV